MTNNTATQAPTAPAPREGVDRCSCGAKYWDGDTCHSCGETFRPTPALRGNAHPYGELAIRAESLGVGDTFHGFTSRAATWRVTKLGRTAEGTPTVSAVSDLGARHTWTTNALNAKALYLRERAS